MLSYALQNYRYVIQILTVIEMVHYYLTFVF